VCVRIRSEGGNDGVLSSIQMREEWKERRREGRREGRKEGRRGRAPLCKIVEEEEGVEGIDGDGDGDGCT